MTKSIKALGMALFAAVAALAVIGPRSSQQKGAAGFEEFSASPLMTSCDRSEVRAISKGTRELIKSIQNAFSELKLMPQGEPDRAMTLGKNCYGGYSTKYSVLTQELTANCANYNSPDSSEASDQNTDATNSFYEQTQLKNCLA